MTPRRPAAARARWLLAAAVLALAVVAGCDGGDSEDSGDGGGKPRIPRGEAPREAPNLLVVMTDDQTLASFTPEYMPATWNLVAERGTVFSRSYATPPLCCPARASFITGQYPSSNGVLANEPGLPDLVDPTNTLGAWLQRAGYRTGIAGKFLNGHEGVAEPTPGWDSWSVFLRAPSYFDYELSLDGEVRAYGGDPADYSTEVLTDRAVGFVRASSDGEQPFFLWLTYNAPHVAPGGEDACENGPQPPTPAGFERVRSEPLPTPPSFDERNVEDKPGFIRRDPPISDDLREALTGRWRCALAAMAAVDGGIERLTSALRRAGELDETVVVYTSDNGYLFGEHRQYDNKRLPYPASVRTPLAIAAPPGLLGGPQADRIDEPVGTVDLAPTLLDFARGRACVHNECREVDGISLRDLLTGDRSGWPRDRAVLLELGDGYFYRGLATRRYRYARYTETYSGPLDEPEEELYDLRADPHELRNLLSTDPGRARPIAARLEARAERLADGEPAP
jgi:N-acetylglucosamine-6-sulfatase